MTAREREILHAVCKYNSPKVVTVPEEKAFMAGAKWADEHPRSNMVDIEDVCEWMHNFQNSKGEYPLYDYVGNFRKAIENKLG